MVQIKAVGPFEFLIYQLPEHPISTFRLFLVVHSTSSTRMRLCAVLLALNGFSGVFSSPVASHHNGEKHAIEVHRSLPFTDS
jgi:hypothetical protein